MVDKSLRAIAVILVAVAAYILAAGEADMAPVIHRDQVAPEPAPPAPTPDPDPVPPLPEPPAPGPAFESHEWAKQKSQADGVPMILLFTADWCGYCQPVKSRLDDLRARGALGVIDIDKEPDLYRHYLGGAGIPCVLVYKVTGPDEWVCTQRYGNSIEILGWLDGVKAKDSSGGAGSSCQPSQYYRRRRR